MGQQQQAPPMPVEAPKMDGETNPFQAMAQSQL
jgi:hypothetical protein